MPDSCGWATKVLRMLQAQERARGSAGGHTLPGVQRLFDRAVANGMQCNLPPMDGRSTM